MADVVAQIVVFLVIAAGLGFAAGWMLRGWGLDDSTQMSDGYERQQRQILLKELLAARAERDAARTQMLQMRGAEAPGSGGAEAPGSGGAKSPTSAGAASSGSAKEAAAPRPTAGTAARAQPLESGSAGHADDLKRIKGIGPKLEQTLHGLGVRRFAQIAAWTPDDVQRINEQLRFQGRVERDNWIEQARALDAAR